jgi:hypothetical protein
MRRRVEGVLRGAAIALLVVVLVRMILASTADGASAVHVRAEGGLTVQARDSLAALARSGQRVTWSGSVSPIAAASEPVRDPSARTRIAVAGTAAVLNDSLGPLDSLGTGGGSLTTSGLAGAVRVSAERTEARTLPTLGPAPGRVLVLGRVGWESKFVVAALEEAGWTVETRLRLSDSLRITQGGGDPAIATHAAVVVLDSALGADAAAITRFVRAGGGVVLSGAGARSSALAALAPASAGAEVAGESDAFERDEPRHALPFRPLTRLRADAVLLERRDDAAAIAARRVQAGRVVQSGYAETWRWRMQAERDGPSGHRAYWNQLVATAAAAPRAVATVPTSAAPAAAARSSDEAPLAALVQQLGAPVTDAPPTAPTIPSIPAWLGALVLLLLLAEWASRRARGAA